MNKNVSVITVNYNQKKVTEALLDSIAKLCSYQPLEIIVVDNGSADNAVPYWIDQYPDVQFIRSETNLGFAGGNNVGIARATGSYLFFVNNDTEFTPGLVESLVAILEQHAEVGMVSPKIRFYSQPTTLQYAGFTPMNYITCRNQCIGFGATDNGQYDKLTGPTGFIHGAAMMVRREAIDKAGPMPEAFFLYYEEMDWCEHIRRAGYTIWADMQALIYHKESVSVGAQSPMKIYYMNRNRILFVRRNSGAFKRSLFWIYFLSVVAPRNIISYIKDGQWKFVKELMKAIFWNLTHGKDSNHPALAK